MYSDCIPIKDIKPGLKNINVVFIVLEVGAATVTKENREVRNFKVADHTAAINVSVWDEPGKLLVPGDIVRLTKGYASLWRHCLTLYSGKNGDIHKIGEFCLAFNEQINMSDPKRTEIQSQMNPNQIPIGLGSGIPPVGGMQPIMINNGSSANNGNAIIMNRPMTVPSPVIPNASPAVTTTSPLSVQQQQQQQQKLSQNSNSRNQNSTSSTSSGSTNEQQQQTKTTQSQKPNRTGRGNQSRLNVKNERR